MSAFQCTLPLTIQFTELVTESRIPALDHASCLISMFTCSICRENLVFLVRINAPGTGFLLALDVESSEQVGEGRVSDAFGVKLPISAGARVCELPASVGGVSGLSLRVQHLLSEFDQRVAADRDRAIQACLAEQYAIAETRTARARAEAAWLLSLSHAAPQHQVALETVPESEHSDDASGRTSTDSDSSSVASSSDESEDDGVAPGPASTPQTSPARITSLSIRDTPVGGGEDFGNWFAVGSLVDMIGGTPHVPEVILPHRRRIPSVDSDASAAPASVHQPQDTSRVLGTSLPIPVLRRPAGGGVPSSLRTQSNERNDSPFNPATDTVQAFYRDDRDIAASLVISEFERLQTMINTGNKATVR
jgi:hypothetical protein